MPPSPPPPLRVMFGDPGVAESGNDCLGFAGSMILATKTPPFTTDVPDRVKSPVPITIISPSQTRLPAIVKSPVTTKIPEPEAGRVNGPCTTVISGLPVVPNTGGTYGDAGVHAGNVVADEQVTELAELVTVFNRALIPPTVPNGPNKFSPPGPISFTPAGLPP